MGAWRYLISQELGSLTFEVWDGDRKLTRQMLRQAKCCGVDEEIKKFLLKEEVANAALFRVSRLFASPLLKLLAASGRLYFGTRKLLVDLFTPFEVRYRLTELEDGGCSVASTLHLRDCVFNGGECDLVIPSMPPWVVHRGFVRKLSKDIEPEWLLKTHFEKRQLERFLEMAALDPDSIPDYHLEKAHRPSADPLPLLCLCDRVGAFADLWMVYPGGKKVPYHEGCDSFRQKEIESGWEKDLLETAFQKKQVGNSHYYCPVDLVAKSLRFLLEIGWQIEDCQGKRVIAQGNIEFALETDIEKIHAKGRVRFDQFEMPLGSVVGCFNRRDHFVSIAPDTVGLLQRDAVPEELSAFFEGEVCGDTVAMRRSHIGLLMQSKTQKALGDLGLLFAKDAEAAVPAPTFCAALRPYQQEGLSWLSHLKKSGFSGILADDMGLGKTVQTLAFLSTFSRPCRVLIVMPTSLLFHWKEEFQRFLPSWSVYVHHGNERLKEEGAHASFDAILTSYATLRLDEALFAQPFDLVVLDEAQAIKNEKTALAQTVYRLQSAMRLSITGTPVENRLEELWSQFHFLLPDLLGAATEFQAAIKAGSADNRFLQRVAKKVAPFVLRRRKEEVAKDLPEKIEQTVWVEMEETQRQIYEEFLTKARSGVLKKIREGDSPKAHRIEILEVLLRLRQLLCHPWLVSTELPPVSAKWEACLSDLETLVQEGGKVLLYSQFTTLLQLLAKEMKERAIPFVLLDGATKDRQSVVHAFQNDPGIPLFLISLKAGGVGLNLTAADSVLLFDPWWNEAVENQAIDRAHRIGQKKAVVAKRYVTRESVEEKMMRLKQQKKRFSEELFDANIDGMTPEDLEYLLT